MLNLPSEYCLLACFYRDKSFQFLKSVKQFHRILIEFSVHVRSLRPSYILSSCILYLKHGQGESTVNRKVNVLVLCTRLPRVRPCWYNDLKVINCVFRREILLCIQRLTRYSWNCPRLASLRAFPKTYGRQDMHVSTIYSWFLP